MSHEPTINMQWFIFTDIPSYYLHLAYNICFTPYTSIVYTNTPPIDKNMPLEQKPNCKYIQ